MVEKSKFSVIVHAQYINSSLYLQLRVQKKKRKKKNAKDKNVVAESAESKQALNLVLGLCFHNSKLKIE